MQFYCSIFKKNSERNNGNNVKNEKIFRKSSKLFKNEKSYVLIILQKKNTLNIKLKLLKLERLFYSFVIVCIANVYKTSPLHNEIFKGIANSVKNTQTRKIHKEKNVMKMMTLGTHSRIHAQRYRRSLLSNCHTMFSQSSLLSKSLLTFSVS